jgi:hypothetical protein
MIGLGIFLCFPRGNSDDKAMTPRASIADMYPAGQPPPPVQPANDGPFAGHSPYLPDMENWARGVTKSFYESTISTPPFCTPTTGMSPRLDRESGGFKHDQKVYLPYQPQTPPSYDQQPQTQQPHDQQPQTQQPYDQQPQTQQPYDEQPPHEQPPYDQPPYDQPPYEQPPYDQQPYDQPPYDQPSYDQQPHNQQQDEQQQGQATNTLQQSIPQSSLVPIGLVQSPATPGYVEPMAILGDDSTQANGQSPYQEPHDSELPAVHGNDEPCEFS